MKIFFESNHYISIFGIVFVVVSLINAITIPVLFMFAVGLGLMMGGVFRALIQIEQRIDKIEVADKISQD